MGSLTVSEFAIWLVVATVVVAMGLGIIMVLDFFGFQNHQYLVGIMAGTIMGRALEDVIKMSKSKRASNDPNSQPRG